MTGSRVNRFAKKLLSMTDPIRVTRASVSAHSGDAVEFLKFNSFRGRSFFALSGEPIHCRGVWVKCLWPYCSKSGGASWINTSTTISLAFEIMSKRRKSFPSETQVKRGKRVVHGEKELMEKVGRNDPCPCGSGKLFKKCCRNTGCFRRRESGLLLSGNENMPHLFTSQVGDSFVTRRPARLRSLHPHGR